MYLLRMEEALGVDYPALQHFLGERGFRGLVAGLRRRCIPRAATP